MSLEINGKRFMNLQEAVAWLLANNALPFQSTANYAANTEIAKSTIINPSPAEIKVGALVLFADSKVGTISGITTNGFMVGSDYTNIKDALNYVSNVEVDSSGDVIFTFSDGTVINGGKIKEISSFSMNASKHLIATYNTGATQDLGLIKGVSGFSIDSSQHLIVTYDNGSTQDLGAIFSGNINISGNLAVSGNIDCDNFIRPATANLRYDAAGQGFQIQSNVNRTASTFYKHARVSNGKLNLVYAIDMEVLNDHTVSSAIWMVYGGQFYLPLALNSSIYTNDGTTTSTGSTAIVAEAYCKTGNQNPTPNKYAEAIMTISKENIDSSNVTLFARMTLLPQDLEVGHYIFRFEFNIIL